MTEPSVPRPPRPAPNVPQAIPNSATPPKLPPQRPSANPPKIIPKSL